MSGISWGRAFGYAVRFVLYSLLWVILGGILILAGIWIATSGFSGVMGFEWWQTQLARHPAGSITIGVLLMILGYIIAALGSIATYFKLMAELIVEVNAYKKEAHSS